MIYCLVLGENTIHINTVTVGSTRLRGNVCLETDKENQAMEKYKQQGENPVLPNPHKSCLFANKDLSLGLLRVCRQVYDESALLFYATNAFTFDHSLDLIAFLDYLMPAQRKAIKSLRVKCAFNSKFRSKHLGHLTSLRDLTVFAKSLTKYNGQGPHEVADELLKFRQSPLKSVKVCFYWPDVVTSAATRKVAQWVEKMLMPEEKEVAKHS